MTKNSIPFIHIFVAVNTGRDVELARQVLFFLKGEELLTLRAGAVITNYTTKITDMGSYRTSIQPDDLVVTVLEQSAPEQNPSLADLRELEVPIMEIRRGSDGLLRVFLHMPEDELRDENLILILEAHANGSLEVSSPRVLSQVPQFVQVARSVEPKPAAGSVAAWVTGRISPLQRARWNVHKKCPSLYMLA